MLDPVNLAILNQVTETNAMYSFFDCICRIVYWHYFWGLGFSSSRTNRVRLES